MIGGQAAQDDWLVCWQGQACGRVHLGHAPCARPVWIWAAWCYPGAQGRCDDLAEGLDCVRRAVIAAEGRMSGHHPDLRLG
jgi:hypothetical protein